MSRSHEHHAARDLHDDSRALLGRDGGPASTASGSKRPRSPGAGPAPDYDYDYYGSADWYGGASDHYGIPSSAGLPRDPWYEYGYEDRDRARGGRYREEWEAYYREKEWEEYYARRASAGAVPRDDRYDLRQRIEGMVPGDVDPYARDHPRGDPRSAYGAPQPLGGAGGVEVGPMAGPAQADASGRPLSASTRPDPLQSDHLMPFRAYVQYHKSSGKTSEPTGDLGQDYQSYRAQVQKRQMWKFFETRKEDKWFIERYSPAEEHAKQRLAWKKAGREGRKEKWIAELKEGRLDKVCFDLKQAKKEPSSTPAHEPKAKLDSTADGEKEAKAADGKEADDKETAEACDEQKDSARTEAKVEPGLEANDHNTSASGQAKGQAGVEGRRRGNSTAQKPFRITTRFGEEKDQGRDELIPPNPLQLLVQNISPEMERIELEERFRKHAGKAFRYLAVSDPREGKRWTRMGYAVFDEGTDLKPIKEAMNEEKIAGLTLNVTFSDRAGMSRVQMAPEVAGSARRLKHDLQQAKALIAKLEAEDRDEVFAPSLDTAAQSHDADGESESNGRRVTADDIAIELPASLSQSATALIEERCSELGLPLSEAVAAVPDDAEVTAKGDELERVRDILKKHLDLHLDALRQVYHTDYYSGLIRDFPEELIRRSPISVRRAPVEPAHEPTSTAAGTDAWCKNVDTRIDMLLKPETLDLEELGGKTIEKEMTEIAAPYIKQEDKDKHRCMVQVDGAPCSKRFVAPGFVQKHIRNKHKKFLEDLAAPRIEKATFFNNYVFDPCRPMPGQNNRQEGANGAGYNAGGAPFNLSNMSPPEMMAMMAQMMGGQMPFDRSMMDRMMGAGPPPGKRARRGGGGGASAGGSLGARLGGKPRDRERDRRGPRYDGPAPEPLPSGPLDPRASHGKRSYQDLDSIPAAEKDVELEY
ncbi:hypothetical protein K437DRAFT_272315 [Tilletiaria anomala UBC 951]|uniref:Arsenite-resistance protein 2 n=1 Tax=Tilletiaria anomala (strain ATCC 24038 / CBS 436.72 / UBC 951) TaxID=1037660 RepID=A0A066WFN3_TILAU|nr:uncharacterized protein K437DRAFT_272315 [Tilletiaria anomala UBC 951]KDN52611.1 hypothetical protein K437DRAFT_272315 [Tilletiaria anomala UBC 951]